jgi:hypothetical protein
MSNIKVDTFSPSGGGTTKALRGIAAAWVQIDGAATPILEDTLNIASLLDLGVGYYRFSFTNGMSGATYCISSTTLQAGIITSGGSRTISSAELINRQSSDGVSAFDGDCSSLINGDLA